MRLFLVDYDENILKPLNFWYLIMQLTYTIISNEVCINNDSMISEAYSMHDIYRSLHDGWKQRLYNYTLLLMISQKWLGFQNYL